MSRRRSSWSSSKSAPSSAKLRDDAALELARRVNGWLETADYETRAFVTPGMSPPDQLKAKKRERLWLAERGKELRDDLTFVLTEAEREALSTAEGVRAALKRRRDERLLRDLPALATRYRDADRRHENYSRDSLANAEGPALLERLEKAPSDVQRKRVEKAALKWLLSAVERVRVDQGEPVLLHELDDRLVAYKRGRAEFVGLGACLKLPRGEKFELTIGPELPPSRSYERCYCHDLLREIAPLTGDAGMDADIRATACPKVRPCDGKCGRLTQYGDLCRFCAHPKWTPVAWLWWSGALGNGGRR